MRHAISISMLVSVLLALSGCGGDEGANADTDAGGGVDAGSGDVDSGPTEEDTDSGADEPDAGPPPVDAGPAADVEWLIEPEALEIDRDIGLDYAYRYSYTVDGDPFVYTLDLERCVNIAGEDPSCWTDSLSNVPGEGGVRWGIDPSQYAIGENSYSFRLVVRRGDEIVDEDFIQLDVTVTDCTSCVGTEPPAE
ncbi:hypothetical protein [Sandaracinus amylolyticus]|uniref:hypothetical protein n=1 Tax=Sandaracinus amylolyticus TaxID=927083 RepID=UPI001F358A48|nr:hypothetical protein [Sandaracinus amylolyticus]UJR81555.1 Hypothetical protein I5071_36150 [Sandaracinus amylolyticus]